MKRIDVYVDTSVFGGIADEEFRDASIRFFNLVCQGRYLIFVSSITLGELVGAPKVVHEYVEKLPVGCIIEVPVSKEVELLAQAYFEAGVVRSKSKVDALHVATAAVAKADLILSWNFRDIVNYDRIRGFNGVNLTMGYNQIDIRSPLEIHDAYDLEDL